MTHRRSASKRRVAVAALQWLVGADLDKDRVKSEDSQVESRVKGGIVSARDGKQQTVEREGGREEWKEGRRWSLVAVEEGSARELQ